MNDIQKKTLLDISRKSIKYYLDAKKKIYPSKNELKENELFEERGTFVTLTINKELRGCIGSILPVKPLIFDVIDNSINAAFRDPRFYPLTAKEFEKILIEISILTVPKKIQFSNVDELFSKISAKKDGVIIRSGFYQATFLPQVWDELPSKENFFKQLCLKAGLSIDCYKMKNLEVETYKVEAFSEKEF